jgi:hypothetical protein
MRIDDHEAADRWGMLGGGGDVVQKCTALVPKTAGSFMWCKNALHCSPKTPEWLHVVQICTTFGEIRCNRD